MAAKQSTAAKPGDAITVVKLETGVVTCLIKGTSPLIFNAMSAKAKHELLLPRGRKTAADKAQTLKHAPIEEFRASVYKRVGDDGPTRLVFPAPAFKGCMATAALEIPGARKAQIGRLVWVEGTHVDVYGIPELLMSVVRSADMNRTPDIRTRAIVRKWACAVTLTYVKPTLTATAVGTLLTAGGLVVAIGDFRQERGKGNFGQFSLVSEDDEEWRRIVEHGGRDAQDAALEAAVPYDAESEELLAWYSAEIARLGRAA